MVSATGGEETACSA